MNPSSHPISRRRFFQGATIAAAGPEDGRLLALAAGLETVLESVNK